ncbi:hypothetical protein [Rickettsia endosymbiont of Nabis limbatus]|uniref:hypothetical protein n=1 Tax=Rickettsia endosymbiont of Nabis limbatus TaxID=3066268 RepID=UPI003AF3E1BE
MNFKCLVPLFSKTILTKINDLIVGTHSLANETFSSFYNSEHQDGIIMKTTKCVIDYTYKFLNNHPSVKPCENPATIIGMVDKNLLLEPKEIVNDTTNIFGKEYDIATGGESYNTLTLNDVAEFLGLEDCSATSVTNALQQWAISQIPNNTQLSPNASQDNNTNWFTQEIDILGAKVPIWSILTAVVTTVGLVGAGIGYGIGKCTQKSNTTIDNGLELQSMLVQPSLELPYPFSYNNKVDSSSSAGSNSNKVIPSVFNLSNNSHYSVPQDNAQEDHVYAEVSKINNENQNIPLLAESAVLNIENQ